MNRSTRLASAAALLVVAALAIGCRDMGAPENPTPHAVPSETPTPSEWLASETAIPTPPTPTARTSPPPPPSELPGREPPDTGAFLQCEQAGAEPGIAVDELFTLVEGGGSTPDEALHGALQTSGLTVPQAGYAPLHETAHDVVFGYRAAGRVKIALHVSREPPPFAPTTDEWTAWSLYACDHREYGVEVELEPELGVWRNRETNHILTDFEGWGHCDMESARLLPLTADDWYIRDPAGVFTDDLQGRYRADTDLPNDAVDTGYRRGADELWLAADRRAVYVVRAEATERWPRHAGEGPGCA